MTGMAEAVAALRRGGLVGLPTETVYGLAADATSVAAVLAIFQAKGRPRFDPLIVHVAAAAQAWTVAVPCPLAERLAAALWPGPLTLVLPRRAVIPDVVTSGLERVAVRCPDHPLARELIARAGVPVAAPSANRFGCLSPTTAEAVREQLGDAVDVVLDGGPCRVGVESTVLRLDPEPVILRPGGITRAQLEAVLERPVAMADRPTIAAGLPAEAPGMLASHYAPRTPLRLRHGPWPSEPGLGLLAFRGDDLPAGAARVEILSPDGDLAIAAARLFACLRRLDAAGVHGIVAETVPEHELGEAINDRLRRAAGLG